MTDKMREEFEAWYDSHHGGNIASLRDDQSGYYITEGTSNMYWTWKKAWQASRAALFVVLPPPADSYETHDIDRCRAAIESAGVKVT